MKLTAVFEPAEEGGYTCFVEEFPAAISQGETETIEEAKANLAEKGLSPHAGVRLSYQLVHLEGVRSVVFMTARAPLAIAAKV